MPIAPDLRHHYDRTWRAISDEIRFGRAGGRCETCSRPHLHMVRTTSDGHWYDAEHLVWRDRAGHQADGPVGSDVPGLRLVRVVIATAHLDHDPTNRHDANLAALCQGCHLRHDLAYHLARRWLTYRRRYAIGDLFLGVYDGSVTAA